MARYAAIIKLMSFMRGPSGPETSSNRSNATNGKITSSLNAKVPRITPTWANTRIAGTRFELLK